MRRKLPLLLTVAFLTVMAIAFVTTVSADLGGFSVSPIFPENQNPETRGFFDLRVEAGTRQEISVAVSNSGEEPIEVSLSLVTASTNRNGIINYSSPGVDDETMLHSFVELAQIAAGGELVTVPPGEAAVVPIFIDIPAEGFDGIILGSVHALLEITEEQRAAVEGLIVNRFAHVVVVRLQERDTEISSSFELGDVRADLVNHRASIIAEVRNTQPRLSMGALVHAQIYPVGADEPIFSSENVSVDFAPNTIFPFSMVDEAGFGLHPGDYLARIQVEHGGDVWDFERNFEILPQQAQEINVAAVNIQQQQHPGEGDDDDALENSPQSNMQWFEDNILLIGGIALLVLAIAVAVLAVMLVRNSKRSKKKQAAEITDEELQRRLESLGVKTAVGGEANSEFGIRNSELGVATTAAVAEETAEAALPSTTADETAEVETPEIKETTAETPSPTMAVETDKENQHKQENVKISVRRKKGR